MGGRGESSGATPLASDSHAHTQPQKTKVVSPEIYNAPHVLGSKGTGMAGNSGGGPQISSFRPAVSPHSRPHASRVQLWGSQHVCPQLGSPCVPDRFAVPSLPICRSRSDPWPVSTWTPTAPQPSPGSSSHRPVKSSPPNPLLVSESWAPRIRESSRPGHPDSTFCPDSASPSRLQTGTQSQRGAVGGRGDGALDRGELEGGCGRGLEPEVGGTRPPRPAPGPPLPRRTLGGGPSWQDRGAADTPVFSGCSELIRLQS